MQTTHDDDAVNALAPESKLTAEERRAVLANMALLPPSVKTPQVAAMLIEAQRNRDLARALHENPGALFARCGATLPPGVNIHVHLSNAADVHLVIAPE